MKVLPLTVPTWVPEGLRTRLFASVSVVYAICGVSTVCTTFWLFHLAVLDEVCPSRALVSQYRTWQSSPQETRTPDFFGCHCTWLTGPMWPSRVSNGVPGYLMSSTMMALLSCATVTMTFGSKGFGSRRTNALECGSGSIWSTVSWELPCGMSVLVPEVPDVPDAEVLAVPLALPAVLPVFAVTFVVAFLFGPSAAAAPPPLEPREVSFP